VDNAALFASRRGLTKLTQLGPPSPTTQQSLENPNLANKIPFLTEEDGHEDDHEDDHEAKLRDLRDRC
jgi:hypothetical protein